MSSDDTSRRRGIEMPRAPKDILAGIVFMAIGLAFATVSTTYDVGTTIRMGPGYFPLILGGLLTVLGGLIVAKGLTDGDEGPVGTIPWRGLTLIIAAVLTFGLTVRGLGLVPAIFMTSLLSAFASRRTGIVRALVIAIGLTVLCVLVFVVALRLRLPLVGPWIPI
jgi:Tripartite tricarboxylate transporter TctB family